MPDTVIVSSYFFFSYTEGKDPETNCVKEVSSVPQSVYILHWLSLCLFHIDF